MRKMKKLAGLVLALALALSLAVPAAFAAPSPTIKITNVVPGQTYTVYKLFDLDSYNPTGAGNYAYTLSNTSRWYEFFANGEGKDYIDLTDERPGTRDNEMIYSVKWKEGVGTDEGTAQLLAQKALAYAKENTSDISISGTRTAGENDTELTITVSEFGYYLIDSSLGAMCSLDTTNPIATVREKNNEPSVTKEVQEDSNLNWGSKNDADIGQVVNFKTTVTAQRGGTNYVLHDKMSEGLDFNNDVVVKYNDAVVSAGIDTYTIVTETGDDCAFHIEFTDTYIDSFDYDAAVNKGGAKIIVEYSATLNENAVVYVAETNETYMDYGVDDTTASATTSTYTYGFNLVKTNDKNTVLDGATFKLFDAETEGNEIKLVLVSEGLYRLAKEGETAVDISAGNVKIEGLDAGTYYLQEESAPEGYNKLPGRQAVTLSDKTSDLQNATITQDGAVADDGTSPADRYENGGVQVINKSGSLLPSTGGMGTTIFYIGGAILALGAVVLLVVKRRMNVDAE